MLARFHCLYITGTESDTGMGRARHLPSPGKEVNEPKSGDILEFNKMHVCL
jgi:hypothetical protein